MLSDIDKHWHAWRKLTSLASVCKQEWVRCKRIAFAVAKINVQFVRIQAVFIRILRKLSYIHALISKKKRLESLNNANM